MIHKENSERKTLGVLLLNFKTTHLFIKAMNAHLQGRALNSGANKDSTTFAKYTKDETIQTPRNNIIIVMLC